MHERHRHRRRLRRNLDLADLLPRGLVHGVEVIRWTRRPTTASRSVDHERLRRDDLRLPATRLRGQRDAREERIAGRYRSRYAIGYPPDLVTGVHVVRGNATQ